MANLLQIASRVEAAMAAYTSVCDFCDRTQWKEKFREEFRSVVEEFRPYAHLNEHIRPSLHPTLAALSIVLYHGEDLSRINRSHPDLHLHGLYKPNVIFPDDISDLLPPGADNWWDRLAEAARREHASQTVPPLAPPTLPRNKVTLSVKEAEELDRLEVEKVMVVVEEAEAEEDAAEDLYAAVKAAEAAVKAAAAVVKSAVQAVAAAEEDVDESEFEGKGAPISVDKELGDSQSHGQPKVTEGAAPPRKRKSSSAALGGAAKRHAQSRKRPDTAEERAGWSDAGPVFQCQCERCEEEGEVCSVLPDCSCKRCKSMKQGCSPMPTNPKTGKTDRHKSTPAELRELNSKGPRPSSTNTPASSPASLPQHPLSQRPALPPSKAPNTHCTPKRSAVEIPAALRHVKATHLQASRTQKNASRASDDGSLTTRIAAAERKLDELEAGSLAARIAAAERRQDELEKLVCELEHRLHKLHSLKKLGA